jgi:pimeloyl-ACP methyl ester carboxylesterase
MSCSVVDAVNNSQQCPFAYGSSPPPTIVLVHGAFADASSWQGVIERLQHLGLGVVAVANPLRGLTSDSAYVASVLRSIRGDIVLVGHSYAGAIISNAAAGNANVKALVFVAAYSTDVGESAMQLTAKFPGSQIDAASYQVPFTTNAQPSISGQTELYIQPNLFRNVFTGPIAPTLASAMAAAQRPAANACFSEKSAAAAWKSIPSWAVIPDNDQLIPPALQCFMTGRARSQTTTVPGGAHAVMLLHPDLVTRVVIEAARYTVRN